MKNQRLLTTLAILTLCVSSFAQTHPGLPFTIAKETTVITGPLHADGTPDYVAALNARYGGMPAKNNAFTIFLSIARPENIGKDMAEKMYQAVGVSPPPADSPLWSLYEATTSDLAPADAEKASAEYDQLRFEPWKSADHPRAAAFLKSQGVILDRVVAASRAPQWWMPVLPYKGTSLLPGDGVAILGIARDVCRGLSNRATMRAGNGDIDGAFDDALAIKRLARLLAHSSTLIERLHALAWDNSADDVLGAIVGSGMLTGGQCKALKTQLAELAPMPPIAEAFDACERWTVLDIAVDVATGKLAPLHEVIDEAAFKNIDIAGTNWDLVLNDINAAFTHAVSAQNAASLLEVRQFADDRKKLANIVATEMASQDESAVRRRPEETRNDYSHRIARWLLAMLLPDIEKPIELQCGNALRSQMLSLLVAAAEAKATKGRWPAALRDVSSAIPHDIYPVDKPGELSYQATSAGARIWSAGPSANKPLAVGVQSVR